MNIHLQIFNSQVGYLTHTQIIGNNMLINMVVDLNLQYVI